MLELDNFYLSKQEPNKSCLLALRTIILKQDELITETIKYGSPCFSYRNKMFCFLWQDKKTEYPYVLFVEGKRLHHPQLIAGNRKRMKVFKVNPNEDIEIETLVLLLNEALNLYRNGTIRTK
ncbi:MAG: DUF1801 domain-containing protein [Flavobacteriales bacterium]|nr:DUF1801 domain-containing protein [Flavobacteriales bacterium]